MRLLIGIVILVIALAVAGMLRKQAPQPQQAVFQTIKAVHYFGASWPKTFWGDFEKSAVNEHLAQIKDDGFNTVILVIPWMGFETGFEDGSPQPSVLYDRLDWLLQEIENSGLNYGLRVGFPHSFDPDNGIDNWTLCHKVFTDQATRSAWLDYIGRIAQHVDRHRDSFSFAFFSWEDFFCPYKTFPSQPLEKRLQLARDSGYQAWLEENYSDSLVGLMNLSSYGSMAEVPIPERKSPAFWLFLKFIDQFLIENLMQPARQILPELAMEIRVDKDPIYIGENIHWAQHDLALSDDQIRGTYWGAYHGARNEGEELTAEQALKNFEYMLNEVSDNGKNTNHIVEQFNFIDNTPAFAGHHARIADSEVADFLQGAAGLLQEKSRGYGLWSYRDYADSALYNGSFERGTHGWRTAGDVSVITNSDGDQALQMQAGSMISQSFMPFDRFVSLGLSEELKFCANVRRPAHPASLTLSINGASVGELAIDSDNTSCVAIDIEKSKQEQIEFSISTDTELEVDDLKLFAFVQRLNIYDENGQPGDLRPTIIKLNKEWLMN